VDVSILTSSLNALYRDARAATRAAKSDSSCSFRTLEVSASPSGGERRDGERAGVKDDGRGESLDLLAIKAISVSV
jgi:hypothetical protein